VTRELLIAVDAGTSVIKALVFDMEGRQLAATSRPNSYDTRPDGAAEQDMARTWADTVAVLQELCERMEGGLDGAIALAITGQGDGTWLVDAAGEPVAPGWLWLDSRAAGIVEELGVRGVRHELYRYTGCGLNACNQSAQLVWMQRNSASVVNRATSVHHCKDWLYFRLTGVRATDVTEGNFTFGNFRTRRYVPEIMDLLGIPGCRRLLPEMVDGTTTTHPLSAAAAAATGLRAGLPVSLGAVDVVCTALGGGLYEPSRYVGCSILGSTGMHMKFVADAASHRLAAEPGGYTMAFPVPGSAAQMQSNMAATLNIDWIVDCGREAAFILGASADRREALAEFDARVLNARPGAALFHPYIHEAGERGPFVDAAARAQFIGLSSRTGYMDLVRAVYEGLVLAARDCYAVMGRLPDEIRVAGGAGRSKALKLLLASALNAPVRESTQWEAGAAGAAMMAAVAIGAFSDMAAAVAKWVAPTLRDTVQPDPTLRALYDRLFPIYLKTRTAMSPVWSDFAAIRRGNP
jgi:erythritol kinase (D-erythritol 1-phosphate-forming)